MGMFFNRIIKKSCLILGLIAIICISEKVSAYKAYSVGDKITYNGMEFYVIKESDISEDSLVLLKSKPLTVDEVNKYGGVDTANNRVNGYISEIYGIPRNEAYSVGGYGSMSYYSHEVDKNDYSSSDVKYVVDAWANDKININDIVKDDFGNSARLITKDEFMSLVNGILEAYDEGTFAANSVEIAENRSWLIEDSYWTMTPYNSTDRVWYVSNDSRIITSYINEFRSALIRPVITLKKTTLEENEPNLELSDDKNGEAVNQSDKNENDKKLTTYKAYNIGDKITYNGMEFYVIKESDISEDSLVLLKSKPLTVDEVNKYGGVGTANNRVNGYISEIYGIPRNEAYNVGGYGKMSYYSHEVDKNDYSLSDIKYVVDAWANDKININDIVKDGFGNSARLITKDEFMSLANGILETYDEGTFAANSVEIAENRSWLIEDSYWTMTPYNDTDRVWYVSNDSRIITSFINEFRNSSVRPVITLKKITLEDSDKSSLFKNIESLMQLDKNENLKTVLKVPNTYKEISLIKVLFGFMLAGISIFLYYLFSNKEKNQ